MLFRKNTVVISKYTNPFQNITLGTYISRKHSLSDSDKNILLLSTSRSSVLIGHNQNCWAECNTNLMRTDGISLVRRDTGGGACYVDKGTRLFSFINKSNKKSYPIILSAMHSLNIGAELMGRNDIVVNNKKTNYKS